MDQLNHQLLKTHTAGVHSPPPLLLLLLFTYFNSDVPFGNFPHVKTDRRDHVLIELATLEERKKRKISNNVHIRIMEKKVPEPTLDM